MSDEDDVDPDSVPDDWEPDEDTLAELEYARNEPDEDDLQWLIDRANEFIQYPTRNPGTESTEKAAGDVRLTSAAAERERQLNRARAATVKRLEDDNGRRRTLIRFIVAAATVPVVVSSAVMVWLVLYERETEVMVSSYFASVVVEVIGLAVIVTKHLFPEGGGTGELPTEPSP